MLILYFIDVETSLRQEIRPFPGEHLERRVKRGVRITAVIRGGEWKMQFDINAEPQDSKMVSWRKVTGDRDGATGCTSRTCDGEARFRVFWNSITARDEVSARERFIKRDIFSCISLPALTRPACRGMPRRRSPQAPFVAELPGSLGPRWIRAEKGRPVKLKGTEVFVVSRSEQITEVVPSPLFSLSPPPRIFEALWKRRCNKRLLIHQFIPRVEIAIN